MSIKKKTNVSIDTLARLTNFIDGPDNQIDFDSDAITGNNARFEARGKLCYSFPVVKFHGDGNLNPRTITINEKTCNKKTWTVFTITVEILDYYGLTNPRFELQKDIFGHITRPVPRFFANKVDAILNSDWPDIEVPRRPSNKA